MNIQQLESKVESQSIQTNFDELNKYPKGYLDGMLWAYDLVLMWIREDNP